ncbi:(Fe-S)-binding protein [Chloroflexota bacterium]
MSTTEMSYSFIPGYAIFWVLFALALGIFVHRIVKLYRLLRLGQGESRFSDMGRRIGAMLVKVVVQVCSLRSVSRKDLAGIGHAFMFWGFLMFLLNYILYIFIGDGFGLSEAIRHNTASLYFSYVVDIAGLFVLLGLVWAAIRRYIIRPERLELSAEAGIILIVIFCLMTAHFFIEGFAIHATGDALASWTPVGLLLANFFAQAGLGTGLAQTLHNAVWWFHYCLIIGFLVFIPYSKHLHLLVSPFNIIFKSLRPKGALVPIGLETAETFGVSKIEQFTWKQLLDGYACAHCGRCENSCPAHLSGKPLSPKELILDINEHLLEAGPALLKAGGGSNEKEGHSLIGDVITEDVLWSCVTCRACQEECPVSNEHIDKIIDMRRHLVLEEARIPETAEAMLRCIETRGHSCRGTTAARTDWIEGLEVKVLSPGEEADILYFVGCAAGLEDRNMKVSAALARLLKASEVDFAILGAEETCCGEPARRTGNEYLFQIQAQRNIEILKSHNVKRIVASCPHCYNTLKNEYPQFGGEFDVLHHSELLADLVKQGKVRPAREIGKLVTYHDSCYLGRYNDIYTPPRELIKAIPAVRVVEMERSCQKGFCCGGGGGHFWIEESIGQRINEMRAEEAIHTKADILATACPYCLQMFEDGIKAKGAEESVKAMDIAELLQSTVE